MQTEPKKMPSKVDVLGRIVGGMRNYERAALVYVLIPSGNYRDDYQYVEAVTQFHEGTLTPKVVYLMPLTTIRSDSFFIKILKNEFGSTDFE